MYITALISDSLEIELGIRSLASIIIIILGVLIVLIGGYQFKKNSTTVNPLVPEDSSKLVTSGLYNFSRNPMYIGFLLFLFAWALFLGSLFALLFLPIFVLVINVVQIVPEEKVLEEKFGDEYRKYISRVRRWV